MRAAPAKVVNDAHQAPGARRGEPLGRARRRTRIPPARQPGGGHSWPRRGSWGPKERAAVGEGVVAGRRAMRGRAAATMAAAAGRLARSASRRPGLGGSGEWVQGRRGIHPRVTSVSEDESGGRSQPRSVARARVGSSTTQRPRLRNGARALGSEARRRKGIGPGALCRLYGAKPVARRERPADNPSAMKTLMLVVAALLLVQAVPAQDKAEFVWFGNTKCASCQTPVNPAHYVVHEGQKAWACSKDCLKKMKEIRRRRWPRRIRRTRSST